MNPRLFLRRVGLIVPLLASAFLSFPSLSSAGGRDPKGEEVARAMMQAMGGQEKWNAAHFVRFDFRVTREGKALGERSHLWDKWTGRYRLESKTKDGKSQVVLFNVNTRQGSAYADGRKLEGPDADKAVENAYGAFINDMYWLAMPWKWLDDGVNLKYIGEKKLGNDNCDVVELTFGKIGLTPGDTYQAYVSRSSHLMTHWEYVLQDKQKGAWDWEYADVKGLKLPANHTNDKKMSIQMGDVRVLDSVEDAFFNDAAKSLSRMK